MCYILLSVFPRNFIASPLLGLWTEFARRADVVSTKRPMNEFTAVAFSRSVIDVRFERKGKPQYLSKETMGRVFHRDF